MRRFFVSVLVAVALTVPIVLFNFGDSASTAAAPASNAIPGQYIVTLKPGERATAVGNRMTAQSEIQIRHVYEHALNGFSAKIPDARLDKIKNDPAVLSVVEDRMITIFSDSHPSGIRRSEADRNALSNIGSQTNPISVDVAVIDSGIDGDHPDLNVVGGVNCVPGESSWEDQHGHGTHVAGTIGALDNGSGVVGVAPGVRLWAVRVLNANGEGEFSDAICGIDWITANADVIEVANMSLGGEGALGSCTDGGFHQAVCTSVNAGVTYVVAAGNSGVDASGFVPAAFPEVITVSALADTDGQPGGNGPSSIFYGDDDTLATFSNFGPAVDIAAPGVNIQSTWVNGGYNTISGTSMASPHVAGAAAIYLYQNPGASPAQTRAGILAEAWTQSSPEGFTGDTDGFAEPLLNAGTIGGLEPLPPPPPPEPGCSLSAESGPVGSSTMLTCAGYQSGEWVWVYFDSVDLGIRSLFIASSAGEGSANVTIPTTTFGEHQILAIGASSGIQASLPFNVEPSVELASNSGKVGSLVYLFVKGFGANESVDMRWYHDSETFTVLKSATTSATGSVNIYASVPDGAGGTYTVEAVGADSGVSGSSEFTILPGLKLSPGIGKVGANVTVTLSGFKAGESADILWSGTTVASGIADDLGKATFQFVVPEAPNGANTIEAEGSAGSQASGSYTIQQAMVLSSTRDNVGTQVDATLSGFVAGETIRLDWYDTTSTFTTLLTVDASVLGSASTSFEIPEGVYGFHSVTATGLTSGKSAKINFMILSNIELSETSGSPGETVTAMMTGYRPNETINVKWYELSYLGEIIGSTESSSLGSATFDFQVPSDTSYGEHKVEGVSASGLNRASMVFTVEGENGPVEATCTADPAADVVTTRVTIDCYGFQPGEYIRIYWDTTASTQRGFISAPNGSGSGYITIPDATGGDHTIIGVGSGSGSEATTTFTVMASFEINKTEGPVGDYLYLNARGYAAGETVNIIWGDGSSSFNAASFTASSTGRAGGFLPVPDVAGGTYTIEALGQTSGSSTTASFTVTGSVKLSPTVGYVGSNVTVTLNGFVPGSSIDIYWDDDAIDSVVVSQNGTASISMSVPEATEGTHSIRAEDAGGEEVAADFRILPRMSLSENRGPVGTEITVEMTGFAAGETIQVKWYDTYSSYTVVGTPSASASGSVTFVLTIPETPYGYHYVKATGLQSSKTVSAGFSLTASVSLSADEGQVGTTVTVTLTGFQANSDVSLRWFTNSYSSYEIATGTADAFGSATITFVIPEDATLGEHTVEGRGAAGYPSARSTLTVT